MSFMFLTISIHSVFGVLYFCSQECCILKVKEIV